MNFAIRQDSIYYFESGIMYDPADRHQRTKQKNLTLRSLRLVSWRLRRAPVTRSLSHTLASVDTPIVSGSNRKDPTSMEAASPLSFTLCPSRLTVLRQRLRIDHGATAKLLGLRPEVLKYLENHTRRFDLETWSNIDFRLTLVDGPKPVSLWEWVAELQAIEARQARPEGSDA